MAIANITNNILTDSGVATSSLLTTSAAASTYLALAGGTLTGALSGTSATFSSSVTTGSMSINSSTIQNTGNFYIGTNNANFIQFYTSNTDRMVITSGGNLLIGTTTDAGYKLDVNGTGRFSSNFYVSGGTSINTGNGVHLFYESNYAQIQLNGATGSLIDFSTSGTDLLGRIIYTNATQQLEIKTTSVATAALTLASTNAATFGSSVTATSFFESSDSRLKTLIQDNYQTKGIASITPKLYTKNGKVELGYYAQDFVGVLDSAVSKGSDDMLSLSYREVLVAKVYALEQRIKELENK